jgi:hypothetical protein
MKTDLDVPRVALVGFAIVVCIAVGVGGATSGAAFDAFNPEWDGASDLRTTVEQTDSEPVIARNTTRYDEYGANTTAFVLSPSEEYTTADVARIRAFLDRGGTLVVADRAGPHGHALLAALGADARPEGPLLRDERHYYRDPALPVATEVGNHSLVDGVDTLTINYGTAVEPGGATVLASTSEYAYLDRDGNETLSENETLASYPVATVEPIGEGAVVTVGDASIFINVMQERDGNRAFITALVAETEHVLIDISRTGSPPPLIAALLIVRESVLLQTGIGIGALVLLRVGSGYAVRS